MTARRRLTSRRSAVTLEYRKSVEESGLDYRILKQMARNSIEYCFAFDAVFVAFERRHDR